MEWRHRWAIQRFNHLSQTNRLLLEVEFNSNCIIETNDLNRLRVNKFNQQNKTNDNIDQGKIIQFIQENSSKSNNELSKKLLELDIKITHQSIGRLRKKYNI